MGRREANRRAIAMNLDVRAVTFDVGGTLIEPWPSVGHVYAAVAAEHGFTGFNPADLTTRFGAAWKSKNGFDYSKAAWRTLVDQSFAGTVPAERMDTLFQDIYARFAEAGAWRVFDDVVPALEALRSAGYKLGVISNWDERLRPLLESLGLSHLFHAIVVSIEVGQTKPAPGIFVRAAELLEIQPEGILHVGDSLQEDVVGAQEAGFSALKLSRSSGNDWGLTSLSALPAALGLARPGTPAN